MLPLDPGRHVPLRRLRVLVDARVPRAQATGDGVDLFTTLTDELNQQWTLIDQGSGIVLIKTSGEPTTRIFLSMDSTTSNVDLWSETGDNQRWVIASAGVTDSDGEPLWTIQSQSLSPTDGRVWLSTNDSGDNVDLWSAVEAKQMWRITCL